MEGGLWWLVAGAASFSVPCRLRWRYGANKCETAVSAVVFRRSEPVAGDLNSDRRDADSHLLVESGTGVSVVAFRGSEPGAGDASSDRRDAGFTLLVYSEMAVSAVTGGNACRLVRGFAS